MRFLPHPPPRVSSSDSGPPRKTQLGMEKWVQKNYKVGSVVSKFMKA